MKTGIGYKLFLLLTMAILLTAGAAIYSLFSLRDLTRSVDRLSQPDVLRMQIDSMLNQIDVAENNMRFYALTDDDQYLKVFNDFSSALAADTAMLRKSSAHLPAGNETVNALSSLLKEKMDLHAALIGIRYSKVFQSAIVSIDSTVSKVNDSKQTQKDSVIVEEKRKFFDRLFGESDSKIREKKLSDSVAYQKEMINFMQQQMTNVGEVGQKGRKDIAKLKNRELNLLKRNELLTSRIRNTLSSLQSQAATVNAEQAKSAKSKAKITGERLQILSLAGSVLVLLLVIAIYRDLAKARRSRKELELSRNKAENLAASREIFLAEISHEIRTPLSAISGLSNLLKQSSATEQNFQYAEAIQQSSTHLLSLVNDLLDDAHIETGKFRLDEKAFNICDLIEEVAVVLNQKAQEKNLRLIIDVKEVANRMLIGDPVRLKQILFNLAGNAIKYTDRGFVSISAKVEKVEKENLLLKLEVKDSGTGMDAELLKRLFGRFEKGEGESSNRESSGLGLYITNRLIDLQQGEIKVNSEKGKGTSMLVQIPYKISSEILEEKKNAETDNTFLKGMKILLAEDDEWNREIGLRLLTNYGADVITVNNGEEALHVLFQQKFSMAFFDLQMPLKDGIETIKNLRAAPENPNHSIPVYALTADRIRHNNKSELIAAGFNDSLLKPLQMEELFSVISGSSKSVNENNHDIDDQSLYDLKDLKKMTGNDENALRHFINLFVASVTKYIHELYHHVNNENWNEASAIAHKIIPSSKQFYAHDLVNLAEEIETWKENIPSKEVAENKIKLLTETAEELFNALSKYKS